jgi:hypothetical protein
MAMAARRACVRGNGPAPRRGGGGSRVGLRHGRRAGPAWLTRAVCGAAVVAGVSACSSAPVVVAVPTFDAAPTTSADAPPTREAGNPLPDTCEDLIRSDEASALFGLPVDSVAVRTVLGTPSPSVGRVERLTCTFTVSGPAPAPLQGVRLQMIIGAYRDAAAAHEQHDRNVADQKAGASGTADPDLGAAAATVVEHDAETVLLTSVDTLTLDLDLARRPAPLSPTDLLTDFARRVLAKLAPDRSNGPSDPSP